MPDMQSWKKAIKSQMKTPLFYVMMSLALAAGASFILSDWLTTTPEEKQQAEQRQRTVEQERRLCEQGRALLRKANKKSDGDIVKLDGGELILVRENRGNELIVSLSSDPDKPTILDIRYWPGCSSVRRIIKQGDPARQKALERFVGNP